MIEHRPERRKTPRKPGPCAFEVLVDERGYPAELSDLSVAGVKGHVDAMTFDEIRERIDSVLGFAMK